MINDSYGSPQHCAKQLHRRREANTNSKPSKTINHPKAHVTRFSTNSKQYRKALSDCGQNGSARGLTPRLVNRKRLENIRRGTVVVVRVASNTVGTRDEKSKRRSLTIHRLHESRIVIRGKLDDLVAVRAPPGWLTARDTLKVLLMHPAKKIRRSLPGVLRSRNEGLRVRA
ncbi:hypothetical protein K0M31_012187 [Melipona bicolor]|uniref:Uncharacterized protein n=1 Tax=Melipona bicolor TaxID=60889 RepID=A0AA40KHS1_9HYME|nr:hypothetical protein K0M31_012187 [Melipona bicolor]